MKHYDQSPGIQLAAIDHNMHDSIHFHPGLSMRVQLAPICQIDGPSSSSTSFSSRTII